MGRYLARIVAVATAVAVACVAVAVAQTYMMRRGLGGGIQPIGPAAALDACTLVGLVTGQDCRAVAGSHYVTPTACALAGEVAAGAECFAGAGTFVALQACGPGVTSNCYQGDAVGVTLVSGAWRWADGSAAATCRQYLAGFAPSGRTGIAASASNDGVYWVQPTGSGAPFKAYCDMGRDEGGWMLAITFPRLATPRANAAGFADGADLTPSDPLVAGMYKGALDDFREAREEISCSASGCLRAYGRSLSVPQLTIVRDVHHTAGRQANNWNTFPACRTSYAGASDDIVNCTRYGAGAVTETTTAGWALDLNQAGHSSGHCWFSRTTLTNPSGQGSPPCNSSTDPNGTRWALLWLR